MTATSAMLSFCIALLLAVNVTALQWIPTPKDGDVIYSCVENDVTIGWRHEVLQAGDVLTGVVWYFHGASDEMVAFMAYGNFIPTPSYSHRVTFVPNAGIKLDHVTKGDAGNYTVSLSGHDGSGASIDISKTVTLVVSEDLMTEDHHLHAAQKAEAEFSPLMQQFHSVLTCGHFTFSTDHPPVSVEWQTPGGTTVPSSDYIRGNFRLLLPNPVTAGVYECRISADSQNGSCSHGQTASVTVDAVLTRLMLLEADNTALTTTIDRLNTTQQTLQAENAALTAKMDTMHHEIENIKNLTQHRVAFTATLEGDVQLSYGATLVLSHVIFNQGNAYNSSTGKFTAPVSGTFHFTAFSTAVDSSHYASLMLMTTRVGGQLRCYAYKEGGQYQTGSVQGTVHLNRGEQAWLIPGTGSYFWSRPDTGFSGFLVSVD